MREQILASLENPNQLEKLYRDNKTVFKKEFNQLYDDIRENKTAQVWNERLNFEAEGISWGSANELIFVVLISLLAGLIAKIPQITGLNEGYFFTRNISFLFFPLLMAYFAWKEKTSVKKFTMVSLIVFANAIYINLLPDTHSDTLLLACIHLPLFTWALLGFVFTGDQYGNLNKRVDFLRYNGDLVVMTALILISGGLMTGITLALFRLIHLYIEDFYFSNIVLPGLAAAPIVATYLVRSNPQLVSKVSPVIAKVFTPIVLVTLVIYLAAVAYTGKNPYNDREFLMIFNLLLIGVMAIILFSIAGTSKSSDSKISVILLLALSIVTILVNGIALSAILFRISEWGITPNRLAVLGGNILILTNLLLVTARLFKSINDTGKIESVETSIASFLPVYVAWTVVVIFIFPVIFGFK